MLKRQTIHHQHVGSAMIVVQDEQFREGYLEGFSLYLQSYQGRLIDESEVYTILTCINDVQHSGRWNAGFLAGFISGMHVSRPRASLFSSTVTLEEIPVEA